MKIKTIFSLLLLGVFLATVSLVSYSQPQKPLKRTDYKTEKFDFGVGGTLSVTGAPKGSITIEGWQNREVEISAEITSEAATEADLALLSKINGFVIDDTLGKVSVVSVGAFDKKSVKKIDKKFPKHLLNAPLRIDYKIRVPLYTDLEITNGNGDFNVSNVEGSFRINLLESNAKFNLVGGFLDATVGTGTVDVNISSQSWRGRMTNVQLANGTMNVFLPLNFNANLDAEVLRTGKIENNYNYLKPRERKMQFTEKQIFAKSGNGGISMRFTVGDGSLNLSEYKIEKAQK